jgi:phage portal protein BeeE
MSSIARYVRHAFRPRRNATIGLDEWMNYFGFGNLQYPIMPTTTLGAKEEEIAESFLGYVRQAYKANGPIFTVMLVRMLLFSEARFQFQRMNAGVPGDLFGNQDLLPLENPWTNAQTGDLLTAMIQDHDLAGNFYGVRLNQQIRRMRPDWVTILLGSQRRPDSDYPNLQVDCEPIGYMYHPGGHRSTEKPEIFLPEQVCHWMTNKDPEANFRGMSWITPIVREIMGDNAATTHKLKFFENGATPNMVVALDPEIEPDKFKEWIELFEDEHEGYLDAYKTLYLGGGANVKVVGANMRQLDFKVTQGAGETRIANAGGVPAVIAGFSEGMQAATYSNYAQARRRFADLTMRPLWRTAAGALGSIVRVPSNARLWYDDRNIPALDEDVKDRAEVQAKQATAAELWVRAGYDPDAVIEAIAADDVTRLRGKHTGFVSVQLQKPGQNSENGASANGATGGAKPAKQE